jgi:hypothetical protein
LTKSPRHLVKAAQVGLSAILVGVPPALWSNSANGQSPGAQIRFALPIACALGRTCEIQNYVDRDPGPAAKDFLCGSNSYEAHSGVDFRIPDMAAQRRGVNVVAAAPGRVTGVRDGMNDVSVKAIERAVIAGRECGNGVVVAHENGLTTQYCHMANGSITVRAGSQVSGGQTLGRVGLSGNTEYPHLHFTVRRGSQIVDPFAPGDGAGQTCGSGQSLWQDQLTPVLGYKAGTILNTGFAASSLTMEHVEAGSINTPTLTSPSVIAYVRAINLRAGDVQQFTLKGPDGAILASTAAPPLANAQAQRLLFIGRNRPVQGWKAGRYVAYYAVVRAGRTIMQREFDLRL